MKVGIQNTVLFIFSCLWIGPLLSQTNFLDLTASTETILQVDQVAFNLTSQKVKCSSKESHEVQIPNCGKFVLREFVSGNHIYILEKDQWGNYKLFYRGEFNGATDNYTMLELSKKLDQPIAKLPADTSVVANMADIENKVSVPLVQKIESPLEKDDFLTKLDEIPYEYEKLIAIIEEGKKGLWNEQFLQQISKKLLYDPSKLQMFMELHKYYPNVNWKELTKEFNFETTQKNFLEWLSQIN